MILYDYPHDMRIIPVSLILRVFRSGLLRTTGVYFLTSSLGFALAFLTLPVFTRTLSPEDYGLTAMFTVLTGIVGLFSGLGVYGAVGRQFYELNKKDFPVYVANSLIVFLLSSSITGFAVWFFGSWISKYSGYPQLWLWTVVLMGSAQCLQMIQLTLWQAMRRPIPYAVFQIGMAMTVTALSLYLVLARNMSWQGRVLAQVWTALGFAAFSFIALWRGGGVRWEWHWSSMRHALCFSIPLIPHTLGMMAMAMTDRILLINMVGLSETGVYSVASNIGMLIAFFQGAFTNAWLPWFMEQLRLNDPVADLRVVRVTYMYNSFLFIFALLFGLFAPSVLGLFLGEKFAASGQYVLWIALGYAFNGMYKMAASYIYYAQKNHWLAGVTLLTAILHAIISYFLIRWQGCVGAAWGTMIAFLISLVATWTLACRCRPMPWLYFMSSAFNRDPASL